MMDEVVSESPDKPPKTMIVIGGALALVGLIAFYVARVNMGYGSVIGGLSPNVLLYWLGGLLMLGGCALVLIAYRIPALKKIFSRSGAVEPEQWTGGELQAIPVQPLTRKAPSKHRWMLALPVAFVFVWGYALFACLLPNYLSVLAIVLFVGFAFPLLVGGAIIHKGDLRLFLIVASITFALVAFAAGPLIFFTLGSRAYYAASPDARRVVSTIIHVVLCGASGTIPIVVGLAAVGYSNLIQSFRAKSEKPVEAGGVS